MAADRVDYDFFIRHLLLSPNFSADGLFIAEEQGVIKGWCLGETVVRNFDPWGEHVNKNRGCGFIMPLAVQEYETGKCLIEAAEKYLADRKCCRIRCAAPGYTLFPNGIAQETYPLIHRIISESGYEISEYSCSMGRSLTDYVTPENIRYAAEKLAEQGIYADSCCIDDLQGLRKLLFESDLKNWMHLPLRKADEKKLDEAVVLRGNGKIFGYCQYNYFGTADRIGPFGIAPEMRGNGAGTVMIARLLEIMAGKKFERAWFASCSEKLVPFYEKNGFKVFRKKSVFEKNLE